MESKFIKNYHGLRGLAALLVFSSHSLGGFIKHDNQADFSVADSLINIGVFGVEMFFFLSGYVIYLTSRNTKGKDFIKKRFWRIYPVFLLFTCLFFVLNAFSQLYPQKDNVIFLINNITFINLFTNSPALTPNAWSITYEIMYYIAIFLTVSVFSNFMCRMAGIAIFIYMILFFPVTTYFLMGVLLAFLVKNNFLNINLISRNIANLLLLMITPVLIYLITLDRNYTNWELFSNQILVYPTMLFLFFWMFLIQKKGSFIDLFLSNRIVLFFGTISYSLYLAHPYSYLFCRKLSEYLFSEIVSKSIFFFMSNLIVTIVWSYLVYIYVEKYFYVRHVEPLSNKPNLSN